MLDDTAVLQLLRYLTGESSPEETHAIRARLDRDPEFRAEVEAWQRVRVARPLAWDTEGALAGLQRELRFGERRPVRLVPFPPAPAKRRPAWYAFRIAAALLIGVGLTTLWRQSAASHAAGRVMAPLALAGLQEYAAPRGGRMAIRLADGSQVVLAPETKLRVSPDFGREGRRREVQLEGEAYFRVRHDAARPFVVHAGGSVTEDIGTAFTVRAYPEDAEVEVVLAEGAVAVGGGARRDAPRRVLAPGQLARIDTAGRLHVESGVDVRRYLAWTVGNLSFNGVAFRQAAADVERWYDLDLRLADSALGARRISGTVAGESPDAVLHYLALVLDARYERQGRVVTFFPRKPSS